MSQKPTSLLLRVWHKWKTLRLPWRRQFLVGSDLNGNTYWEFLDRGTPLPKSHSHNTTTSSSPNNTLRWRRIVHYPRGTHHDSVTVPPAWHQWLRYTRPSPPSLEEQRAEVTRQARIKLLAAAADARWEAKPKVMDIPEAEQRKAQLGVREPATMTERKVGPGADPKGRVEGGMDGTGKTARSGVDDGVGADVGDRDKEAVDLREELWRRTEEEARAKKGGKEADPWKQASRGGPSESWQPAAWDPSARSKK